MAISSSKLLLAGLTSVVLAACSGGSTDTGGGGDDGGSSGPPPSGPVGRMATPVEASVFLTQATFGPSLADIERNAGQSASDWFVAQTNAAPSYLLDDVDYYISLVRDPDDFSGFARDSATIAFWRNAISANDQLRQRMAFALSQILVVSGNTGELESSPDGLATYQDILIRHAFGNYRDLLEDVTYSPAMGNYLTYLGSRKANPNTGRMPDENYARELLQLFTIGVVEIDQGGEIVTQGGQPVELFDNDDIRGLARVFTGFVYGREIQSYEDWRAAMREPMQINANRHSLEEKSFLGLTIPAGIGGEESVARALDHIMEQPTLAPFLSRQLIQRFTTSDPDPAYVRRVADAFESGSFQLPNMVTVGAGRRGDLTATVAAVLFDPSVSDIDAARANDQFGKLREPVLRMAHWARAFEVSGQEAIYVFDIHNTSGTQRLNQTPYRAASVFNFYRPGFVAPGSQSGALGMTVPELQIFNSASTAGYVNFIDDFILDDLDDRNIDQVTRRITNRNVSLSPQAALSAWLPTYADEIALADDHEALLDHLDLLLTGNTLSDGTRALVLEQLDADQAAGTDTAEEIRDRVQMAVLLIITSPDYLVQR